MEHKAQQVLKAPMAHKAQQVLKVS